MCPCVALSAGSSSALHGLADDQRHEDLCAAGRAALGSVSRRPGAQPASARPLTSTPSKKKGLFPLTASEPEETESGTRALEIKGWRSDAKSLNDLLKVEARWPFRSRGHGLLLSALSALINVEAPFCTVAVNDFNERKWLEGCARAAADGHLVTEARCCNDLPVGQWR